TDHDPPANTLTFSLVGAPAGASIDPSTGVFTWTPTEAQGPGSYPFTVQVTDNGSPNLSDSKPITITVSEVNVAPVLANVPSAVTIPEEQAYTFTATATYHDLPANTLTFSLVGAPTSAAIDPTTGVFTRTTTEAQSPGSYPFSVVVSDGSLTDTRSITITVAEVNVAPVLANVPSAVTIGRAQGNTSRASAKDDE